MVRIRTLRPLAAAALAAAALTLPSGASGTGGYGPGGPPPPTFIVVPPDQTWSGMTYPQLAGAWWSWASRIPSSLSPVADRTGFLCRIGQAGSFFFLAQSTGGPPVRRTCNVPAGKAIFFPAITVRCSGKPPAQSPGVVGGTPADDVRLNACAKRSADRINFVQVDVDRQTLMAADFPRGPVVMPFRARSAPVTVQFTPRNPFGAAAGSARLVADGFWVLLRPLKPGTTHTINIRGRVRGGFATNVTYRLRVGAAAGVTP
jgi:hypothetical protein